MRRLLMAAVFGVGTLAAVGCAGNASFKQKTPSGGVVELKAGGSMDEVHRLLEKEVGKDYVIDHEEFAPIGGKFDPAKPVTNGQAPAGSKVIVYHKKTAAEMSGMGGLPPVTGTGMPGAPGGVGQAGFQQRQPAGGTGFPNSGGSGLGGGTTVGGSGFGTGGDGGVGQPPALYPPSR